MALFWTTYFLVFGPRGRKYFQVQVKSRVVGVKSKSSLRSTNLWLKSHWSQSSMTSVQTSVENRFWSESQTDLWIFTLMLFYSSYQLRSGFKRFEKSKNTNPCPHPLCHHRKMPPLLIYLFVFLFPTMPGSDWPPAVPVTFHFTSCAHWSLSLDRTGSKLVIWIVFVHS